MDKIYELIKKHDNFVVAGHKNPDGDAIGACYGLAFALKKLEKKVHVVLENYAVKYDVIPGKEFLYKGPLDNLPLDVLICLDCADAERLGGAISLFKRAEITVCIDHHETNNGFAQYNVVDGDASSASEVVFRLIDMLVEPDVEIASAIYAGLIYDSGGFRYSAAGKITLETAGRLMEMGIPFSEIYSEMLHKHTFSAAKILGIALKNCMLSLDGRIISSYVTRDMIRETGANDMDIDGIVEYLIDTRGTEIALFLYEKEGPNNEVKASFRSRSINVGLIAAALGGGGHKLAAGCTVNGDIHTLSRELLDNFIKSILERDKN